MTRVVVTGADGFVGRRLVPMLCQQGHDVTALVRGRSHAVWPRARYVDCGDLIVSPLEQWLQSQEAIVHLVGRTHSADMADLAAREAYEATNVQLLSRLARAALGQGVRRFVFLSSIKVLGERTEGRPFQSSHVPAPEDLYGVTKLAAEVALATIAQGDMEHVVLRPPLVIGPGVKGNLLRLLRLIDRGIPLPLASVRNVRSLICLDNLCDVLVRCIDHPAAAGRTFLAADGTDVSTPNLLRAMAAALDVPLRMLPFPVGLLGVAARMFGRGGEFERLAGSLQVDSAEIRDVLGWRPPVAFADQMAATADWYRTVGRL